MNKKGKKMNDENTKMGVEPTDEALAIPEFLDRKDEVLWAKESEPGPSEEVWGEEEVAYVQTAEDTCDVAGVSAN